MSAATSSAFLPAFTPSCAAVTNSRFIRANSTRSVQAISDVPWPVITVSTFLTVESACSSVCRWPRTAGRTLRQADRIRGSGWFRGQDWGGRERRGASTHAAQRRESPAVIGVTPRQIIHESRRVVTRMLRVVFKDRRRGCSSGARRELRETTFLAIF